MNIRKITNTRKRGQEEIVGFVLIMVLVAVVFLVFLGITIKKGAIETRDSKDVYQFLESSMEYTTDCAVRFVPDYSRMGELIEECYDNKKCLDGRNSCKVFNDTMNKAIRDSWNVGDESSVKGFKFAAAYSSSSDEEKIMAFEEGECNSKIKGATYLIPSFPGTIEINFQICQD